MTQPKLLSKAWASDGLKNDIPAARQAGAAQEAATYSEGFPSITMTPLSLGGKPPSGKDMNGVLHDVVVAGDEVKGDEHGQPRDSQDEGDCGKDGRH